MFEKLLVTTDLSEASENLIRCLGPLRAVGARGATLVHVADIRDVGGLYLSLKNLIGPRMDHLEGILRDQGYTTRAATTTGRPAREISKMALSGDYSLIVAGTHGESLAKEVLLGSVVHGLLQSVLKPVFLIPFDILAQVEKDRCRPICGDFFKRVLFATDFSATADTALSYLRHVVQKTKAEVMLYHVQDQTRIEPHLKEKLEEFNRVDMARFDRIEMDLLEAGVKSVCREIDYGNPAKLLVEKANSGTFGLLLMGSQGRDYLVEDALGRVAHYVVHHADLPVMLIPLGA